MELPVKQFQTQGEQAFLDAFTAAEATLPGDKWVGELRRQAAKTYGMLGLPHRRVEAWKYTDLRSLLTEAHPFAEAKPRALSKAEIARGIGDRLAAIPAYRLVVAQGALAPALSDLAPLQAAGAEIVSLADALRKPAPWLKKVLGETRSPAEAIVALNTALMTGGVVLRLAKNRTLDKPVHVIHLDGKGESVGIVTRNIVMVEEGASLTLIESYAGVNSRALQRNAVTEMMVGDQGAIDHIKLQREGEATVHLCTWLVRLGADARYGAFQFSTGAAVSRSQIFAAFMGEGSSLNISGALLMRGRQHCDTTLLIEHKVPRCVSRELFKAVLDNEARGVFQGKIIVSPGAQKTDGKQMAQALLLSEAAEFDSKPELEIFADDVVCGHGSTSGQIDEDLLFYLEARGIPEAEARALLIQAFVGEAIEQIEHEDLRDALNAASAEWLGVELG
jgi:FeS assembly protein SufD